ncbi:MULTISPECIES: 6,7-dimethyl-8-ribityllumazine synthase [unclassified Caulobacter]|jgi:6,7-dimethyl-8-ribityllumazine synthase|uniref:6,7-dimethyl-8-ribityllumazine synthase n=1 Tax=unclassified Caulobacter TaxID=2648921 RepID=UPI0007809BA5|nr:MULTISPECIES: 6,7-dimethyl-8-ribityllumazine synthase [unclassified Caulobacter]AZS21771.1 6,7-dimethyl-8-ribityllumazine synthase [Caulobacter sp. FWC26]
MTHDLPRIALVVSRFNADIVDGLVLGARAVLEAEGVSLGEEDIVEAPGAFELPLIAQTLAASGRFDGIVCLGCVIKGDTAHFEYISQGVAAGLMTAGLSTGRPISFGVLTTYDEDQALARSREDVDNKGREAAHACLQAWRTLRSIRSRAA